MIALLLAAQVADGWTASVMPPGSEVNGLAALLLDHGVGLIAKIVLVSVILAVAANCDVKHPRLASAILLIGIVAGMVGTISNLAVLRAA